MIKVKDLMLRGPVVAVAAAGIIRLGLAFWRESDRLEALLITLTSFVLIGVGYLVFFRSEK